MSKTRRQIYLALLPVSLGLSVSLFFLCYIYLLQTYAISVKRILFGVALVTVLSVAFFLITQTILKKWFFNDFVRFLKTMGFWMFMALLFSPHIFPVPHYPVSSLFQKTSEIEIVFSFLEYGGKPVQLRGVWLDFDDKKYSSSDFQISGEWVNDSGKFYIDPNLKGKLYWRGKIGENAKLTIFPMDETTHVTVIWDGEESSTRLKDKPFTIKKKITTPFAYYFTFVMARVICFGFFFWVLFSFFLPPRNAHILQLIVICVIVISIAYTVYAQFENPEIKDRLDIQIGRHDAVMLGQSPNPWQYRVLSEWVLEGLLSGASLFGTGIPYFEVFLVFRVLQNSLIFILSYLYFRALGYSNQISLVGIIFISGSLVNSFHQSDLSFNTYSDLIFYIIAALLLLRAHFVWLPVLVFCAALNRETSGLIPFLALAVLPNLSVFEKKMQITLTSLGVWLLVFFALRFYFPANELFIPYGYEPGLPLLGYNLSLFSFYMLLRFFSFAPLVGLVFLKDWNFFLKRFFIALIPIWFSIHFVGSVVSESRLFLVPQVLVFIPGFLHVVSLESEGILSGESHT